MKSILPSLLALIVGAAGIYSPELQGAIAAHPAVAAVLASAYAVLSHLLPSPVAVPPAK